MKRAVFALPSKPVLRPEPPDSPRVNTGQRMIWKRGVLRGGFASRE